MTPDDGSAGTGAIDAGGSAGAGTPRRQTEPLPSDPAAIEALIARRRAELADTVDELVVRAHPKEIARRSAADARSRLRAFAVAEDGQLRVERLAAIAAAAASLLGLVVLRRRRRHRAR
jgi:Protein of unknown function (DUF3618)